MKKMSKRIMSLFVCVALVFSLLGMFSVSASASAPSGYNYNQAKLITLTFSQCVKQENGKLAVKSDTEFDWTLLNSDINGVVILPFILVNGQTLAQFDITNRGLQSNEMADIMAQVITKVNTVNPSLNIWFGTPEISSKSYLSATTAKCLTPFTNYVTAVKSKVSTSIWSNRIKGVYYAQESIYGTIDYSNLVNNNPQIRLMNDFAYRVHANFKKDMLWIPYYGTGTNAGDIIKKIGYVANTTPIFDCVVMQPHNEFDPSTPISNLSAVQYSTENQTVVYRDNTPVVARSSSATAVIGAELEYNEWLYGNSQIGTYISYFGKFSGNRPLIFYWQGDMTNTANVKAKINSVF